MAALGITPIDRNTVVATDAAATPTGFVVLGTYRAQDSPANNRSWIVRTDGSGAVVSAAADLFAGTYADLRFFEIYDVSSAGVVFAKAEATAREASIAAIAADNGVLWLRARPLATS